MCGICCALPLTQCNQTSNIELEQTLADILKNRGPDVQHEILLNNGMLFHGCVLWQQGKIPTRQPLESEKFVLLFNGDIYNAAKDTEISDTSWLLSQLNECNSKADLFKLIKILQGPYSMIVYDKINEYLYFLRDPLGRNSLLLENSQEILRILSSSYVSKNAHTIEVPALGIFQLHIPSLECILYPWEKEYDVNSVMIVSNVLAQEVKISEILGVQWSACERREPLYSFPDHLASFTHVGNFFEDLLNVQPIVQTVNQLIALLRHSVEDRVKNTPKYCSICVKEYINGKNASLICSHSKLGILFSGGIDCTILAVIAHEYVDPHEPIDLINVAFEPVNKSNSSIDGYNVPDRLSALDSLKELKTLFPEREWNFIEVNVNRNDLQTKMQNHICNLIYPLETVLDESLGCAFWFASCGIGKTNETTCRVILVGSGADELFGGYIRHRNAYNRCKGSLQDKIESLDQELRLDWNRIPTRNLGRDDRIIADNGRTSRAPFIEENLVQFITGLHPLEICCFELDQGIGDKLLLRLLGHKLGLRSATQLKKRAIQFGSRIADKNQNAKDTSVYLCKE